MVTLSNYLINYQFKEMPKEGRKLKVVAGLLKLINNFVSNEK